MSYWQHGYGAYQNFYQYSGRPPEPMHDPKTAPMHQPHQPLPQKDWHAWGNQSAAAPSAFPPPPQPPPQQLYPGGWTSDPRAAAQSSYSVQPRPSEPIDEEGEGLDDQPVPKNPGSSGHPNNCKPCNKYNRSRPDSCKHEDKCDFCHMDHERPKHRGQRGRHALQRRQYLENREDMPKYLRDLIDQIYTVPHRIIDEIKGLLGNVSVSSERDHKCGLVLTRIRDIGIMAQNSRPDHARLRGAVIDTGIDGPVSTAELDGRCKWLIGTLHLMVRKMHDSKEPQNRIEDSVANVLEQCKSLKNLITSDEEPNAQVRSAMEATELQSMQQQVTSDADYASSALRLPKTVEDRLRDHLKVWKIAYEKFEALVRNEPEHEIQSLLKSFEQAEDQARNMNDQERLDMGHLLRDCRSLSEFKKCLQENDVIDDFRSRFLDELEGAQGFDDLEHLQAVKPVFPIVPRKECSVTWKGGEFRLPYNEGGSAGSLREAIAKYLTEPSHTPVGAPTVLTSQVHLGVLGLPMEFDDKDSIPPLVQEHLRAVIVVTVSEEDMKLPSIKAYAKILLILEEDESWCSKSDFALLTAMINALDARQILKDAVELKEALTAKAHLASVFELVKRDIGQEDFKRLRELVGEPHANLRIELNDRFKFLEEKVNSLTLQELKTARSINRVRQILDDIVLEANKPEKDTEHHEIQARLASSEKLGVLRDRIRDALDPLA